MLYVIPAHGPTIFVARSFIDSASTLCLKDRTRIVPKYESIVVITISTIDGIKPISVIELETLRTLFVFDYLNNAL